MHRLRLGQFETVWQICTLWHVVHNVAQEWYGGLRSDVLSKGYCTYECASYCYRVTCGPCHTKLSSDTAAQVLTLWTLFGQRVILVSMGSVLMLTEWNGCGYSVCGSVLMLTE